MFDTRELGAGSYPESNEPKYKCYQFEFIGTIQGCGVIYAEDRETALAELNENKYDDILDTWGMEITEITKLEEE
jgi:hypothetical protein